MNIIGANYRTTLSGLGETICLIIIGLCVLPAETWQNPKVWLPATGLITAKTIKDFLTKDKAVTGGSVQQTLTGAVADEGRQTLVDATLKATPHKDLTLKQQAIAKTLI